MPDTAPAEEVLRLQQQAIELYAGGDREGALTAIEAAIKGLEGPPGIDAVAVATAYQIAGGLAFAARRWAEAEAHNRRAIGILRSVEGGKHLDLYPVVLQNLSILYCNRGQFSEAIPLILDALDALEKIPDSHAKRANALTTLAAIRNKEGREKDAELLYQNAVSLWDHVSGDNGHDFISGVERLAEFYQGHGNYLKAEEHYRKSLTLRETTFGPRSVAAAEGAGHLARVLLAQNKYEDAESYFRSSIELGHQVLGSSFPGLGTALNNLAVLCKRKGDSIEAERFYKKALEIQRVESYGSPEHINTLANFAVLCESTGCFSEAETARKEISCILSLTTEPTSDMFFTNLSQLAALYERTERPNEAEVVLRDLLEINRRRTRAPSSEGLEVAIRLQNVRRKLGTPGRVDGLDSKVELLGKAVELNRESMKEHSAGHYRSAFRLSAQHLANVESAVGTDHPYVVAALSNLGMLAHEIGDYRAAELYYQRALNIAGRTYSEDDRGWGALLNNVGEFRRARGDFILAKEFYERAQSARLRSFGPESAEYAASLNSLASVLKDTGDLSAAEQLYRQALQIAEAAKDTRGTNTITANLGLLAFMQERYTEAESLLRQALPLAGTDLENSHVDVALIQVNIASMEEGKGHLEAAEELLNRALSRERDSLGEEHPFVANTLRRLAKLKARGNDVHEAVALFSKQISIEEKHLAQLLVGGSERDRHLATGRLASTTAEIVSFHVQVAPNDLDALRLAFETVLKRKGRVLDAMADSFAHLRERSSPEHQALFARLSDVSAQLGVLGERRPHGTRSHGYRQLAMQLEQERADLEATAAERSAEFRADLAQVNLEAVRNALPEGYALIELFRYHSKSEWATSTSERHDEVRYVGYVLRRTGELAWKDLGEAQSLERALWDLRAALSNTSHADVRPLSMVVEERVTRPLRNLLGDEASILLSPDGVLNLIPFAALLDETGKYLLERFEFTYLSSGRDLMRLQSRRPTRSAPMVVANPNYLLRGRDPTRRSWPLLPQTLGEAEAISELLIDAKLVTWDAATEGALRKVAGPRVLHVATHGYFESQAGVVSDSSDNPLLRSGLVMAGANGSCEGDDDGLFSALEVSGLDLWGTRLVVLSACETALGDIANGEGVYGLRRALVLAGSESQLITLWNVSSKATQDLMHTYYGKLCAGAGRSASLRAAQLVMLADPQRCHPFYWAPFILSGEWSALPA